MKLALGAELPAAGEDFLPSTTDIVRALSRRPSGQTPGSTTRVEEALSGSPARPGDSLDDSPLPGDEMFPVLLADAVRGGHITTAEANERLEHHKLVVASRTVS